MWLSVALALCVGMAVPFAAGAVPTFTGDVEADFTDPGTVTIADPGGVDVGMPGAFPPGTISGCDMKNVMLFYDDAADVLYVGINFYGIGGDVDGDGDPSHTSTTLAGLGGTDFAQFNNSEALAFMIDTDPGLIEPLDQEYEFIVGDPLLTSLSSFEICPYLAGSTPFNPSNAFDLGPACDALTFYNTPTGPVAGKPDFEFTIPGYSSYDPNPDLTAYAYQTFCGSLSDDGIGEDFLPGFEFETAIDLVSFEAAQVSRDVSITWETATENDNAGFQIYRAESYEGPYEIINTSLIPAEGNEYTGASYEFTDEDVRIGHTYYYQLTDIDLEGKATTHGPVDVKVTFAGCGIVEGGTANLGLVLFVLGMAILAAKKTARKGYRKPEVKTTSSDKLVAKLGPAQTCSPSPSCPTAQ